VEKMTLAFLSAMKAQDCHLPIKRKYLNASLEQTHHVKEVLVKEVGLDFLSLMPS
jgi:hypothetical protein